MAWQLQAHVHEQQSTNSIKIMGNFGHLISLGSSIMWSFLNKVEQKKTHNDIASVLM
jgi:hypothetical protein